LDKEAECRRGIETLREIEFLLVRVVSVREIMDGEQIKARGGVEDVWVG